MQRLKLHIPEKKRIYLMFAVMVVMSIALLFCAQRFHHQHMQSVTQLKQQLQAVHMRHAALRAEQAMIQQYLPQYQQLITQRFAGRAQRSLWIDQLIQSQQSQQLFPVSYTILAQQAFAAESAQDWSAMQLYRTPMKIEMDLLHEEDLLGLLDSLKISHVGAFILRECKISRLSPSAVFEQKLVPNLHAVCTIDWLTVSKTTALTVDDAP